MVDLLENISLVASLSRCLVCLVCLVRQRFNRPQSLDFAAQAQPCCTHVRIFSFRQRSSIHSIGQLSQQRLSQTEAFADSGLPRTSLPLNVMPISTTWYCGYYRYGPTLLAAAKVVDGLVAVQKELDMQSSNPRQVREIYEGYRGIMNVGSPGTQRNFF